MFLLSFIFPSYFWCLTIVLHFQVRTNESIGILSWEHLVSTILHLIQISLAYILMLIVMTFNTWLCLSVVIGSTLGYFLIGWKKPPGIDVSDHCHWLETDNPNNPEVRIQRSSIRVMLSTVDITLLKRNVMWYLNYLLRKVRRLVSYFIRAVLNVRKLLR